jgi:hypothetical protein
MCTGLICSSVWLYNLNIKLWNMITSSTNWEVFSWSYGSAGDYVLLLLLHWSYLLAFFKPIWKHKNTWWNDNAGPWTSKLCSQIHKHNQLWKITIRYFAPAMQHWVMCSWKNNMLFRVHAIFLVFLFIQMLYLYFWNR